jgi:hypothetical protein
MPATRLRASLLIAGAGAVLILIDVGGTAAALTGLGLIVLGMLLTTPARTAIGRDDVDWWRLLRIGALLVGAGIAVGLLVDSIGGLLAAAGAVCVVIAAALALP